jgi:hypothetical protein
MRIGIVKAQKAVIIRHLSLYHVQNFRLTPLGTVPACLDKLRTVPTCFYAGFSVI